MTNDQLAAIIASFIVANAASVAVAVKWVFSHALDYQLLKSKVYDDIEKRLSKAEKDVTAAHIKIKGEK